MVYITNIRLSGGSGHEHITDVKWQQPSDGSVGQDTKAEMVDWIKNKNGVARVKDNSGNDIDVKVVNATPPYLRTQADGVWTDNLLALPRF
jgi:hypothetical protein